MWKLKMAIIGLCLLWTAPVAGARSPTADVDSLWLDISIGAPLVDWFNNTARPADIARLENASQLYLLDQISAGRKLLVLKSAAEAEHVLPEIASEIDIIGYNLEHGPANRADEQAAPVASVQRMRALADAHDLVLAFGPDHDFALSHGEAVAPYVDIFVLQVQRVQTQPRTVLDFVLPLIPRLRAANPDLQITVQVRTEGDVAAIAGLVSSLDDELDGVSILTSPETVSVAQDLVATLRSGEGGSQVESEAAPAAAPAGDTARETPWLFWSGSLIALVLGGWLLAFFVISGNRK